MNKKIQLLPVMLCFFAMGFVDLVGIASNYVQADLGLSGGTVFPLLMGFASDAAGPLIRTASSSKSISWNGCAMFHKCTIFSVSLPKSA